MNFPKKLPRRILVVDDNPDIHADFRSILSGSEKTGDLERFEKDLFDITPPDRPVCLEYSLECALTGQDAVSMVREALESGQPYMVAFIDMRMPSGLDGIETTSKLWQVDTKLQIVICTAYSDYSWEEITASQGVRENLLILKKPFDAVEVLQLCSALTEKWFLGRRASLKTEELHRANDALQESEKRFKNIFGSMQNGYILCGLDGSIQLVNPAALMILGYDHTDQIIAKDFCFDICAKPDQGFDLMDRVKASGSLEGQIIELRGQNGQAVDVEANIHMLKDIDNKALALGVVFQDIAERKAAEAQKEVLISELEIKNAEMERLIHTISHCLKKPMNTITAFLSDLEMMDAHNPLDGEDQFKAARTYNAAERMERLIDELHKLARVGQVRNPPESISFSDLARAEAVKVFGKADRQNISFKIHENMPCVFCDLSRIRLVLHHLLDNACRFMGDQCEPHIEIGSRGNGDGLAFYVKDNGLGIEAADQERVFDLFAKLDPSRAGYGIGLSIVKRIILIHGGKIWIESSGGNKGATFCFTLPLMEAP